MEQLRPLLWGTQQTEGSSPCHRRLGVNAPWAFQDPCLRPSPTVLHPPVKTHLYWVELYLSSRYVPWYL